MYMMFDEVSTLVISCWLISTTRRWDRGSVWGHTLFLSELIFLVSMRKPILPVAGDQASISGVNRVLSPKKLWMFFICQQKFSEKHKFFFDRLKGLLVVQILEVTAYQESAEHIRLITFHWQSEKVEMGGTCLGEQK